jgi:hypothetical protein
MRFYRIYQKLLSEKYKKYGNLLALLPEIAAREKFTHKDIFLGMDKKVRRNVLRIFHNLELIKVIDNNPTLHTFAPTAGLFKFLKYTEVIGLEEFKMGPYRVFMDTPSLNAYLLERQKPITVTVVEDVQPKPEVPPFHQLIITGADGVRIMYFHILTVPKPIEFVEQGEKPGLMSWINRMIASSQVTNAVFMPERIGATWGYSIFGTVPFGDGDLMSTLFRTYWNPSMKMEENLIKDELYVLSSFVGIIPTGHILKTMKIQKEVSQ